jgi:RNA polymerase sigma-70 factor (ECF subfamily)
MNEWAGGYPGALVSLDEGLDREFEDRLRESSTLAFRVAYGVLRHRQDAEDVAQDALFRAFQAFGGLRDRERFRPWLVRIAWRLSLDRRRADRRRSRREQEAATSAGPSVEQVAAAGEFEARLWRAMDELPKKLRLVVVLAAMEGHDTREVARLLDLREGTVKSRLHAARRRLAERLR